MHKTLTIILFLIGTIAYSQHTDRFISFTSSIKPIDSIEVNLKFRNGNPKKNGVIIIYESGDYHYEMYTGKLTEYYKSGDIKSIDEFDNIGNLISSQLYDFEGTLYCDMNTLKIDTEAKSIDEFFSTEEHLSILIHAKKYRLSLFPGKWFLLEEGNTLNGERIDKWKRYNKDGTIKEVTDY